MKKVSTSINCAIYLSSSCLLNTVEMFIKLEIIAQKIPQFPFLRLPVVISKLLGLWPHPEPQQWGDSNQELLTWRALKLERWWGGCYQMKWAQAAKAPCPVPGPQQLPHAVSNSFRFHVISVSPWEIPQKSQLKTHWSSSWLRVQFKSQVKQWVVWSMWQKPLLAFCGSDFL